MTGITSTYCVSHAINNTLPSKFQPWRIVEEEEVAREGEGSEVYQKNAMTAQRALDEPTNDTSPAPNISGFTPINHTAYSNPDPIDAEPKDAAIKSKSAAKPRAPKKRKAQSSAATTTAKPKKTNRAKTAAQLDCQDISQGLSRNKPTSFGDGALPGEAVLSLGEPPLEKGLESQRSGETSAGLEIKAAISLMKKQGKPSGLAAKYQAEYEHGRGNTIDQATTPTPPKSDRVQMELDGNDWFKNHDFPAVQRASPDIDVELATTVRDFGASPFTQTSSPILQARSSSGTMMGDDFNLLNPVSHKFLVVDDLKSGDYGEGDEFPIDDECLEEMMQSVALPAEEESLGSDWPPQDFSDDTTCMDKQLENDHSHWPRAMSDSDGVVTYDEDPTLVASDFMNVSSSPQSGPQASCHANPDRGKTSEGPEECFDDDDLEDGLFDLIVNEAKSDQMTCPVTPSKRPLSPKLQWLPPKVYTPARSSQLPVSPTNDPHIVQGNSKGDLLPFVRPPFPKAIRDRSPILGLSNHTVLRICFRVGEALNAAAIASRTNVDAIIELYARVVCSSREADGGYKQFFQFGDLFTDKPPYLSGTYTLWKGVGLWDKDSKQLVGEQGKGKMVRVLGRIKRREPVQKQGPGVEMSVLSIWEVDWEDVGIAKGIACLETS